jgi:putative ABC transport system permease protein
VLGTPALMVVREIRRRPLRFAMSVLGIGMGVAIFVMGRSSWDSFDHLMTEQFPRQHREDITVTVARAVPVRALRELEHVPGVELAEGQRMVAVRFRAAARWRDAAIIGRPEPAVLNQLIHAGRSLVDLPPQGLVMTDRLAELLEVRIGDEVWVEILEGDFATRALPIVGLIDEAFGLQAYARADWLATVLREEPRVNTLLLRVDPVHADAVRDRLKELPSVISVTSTESIIRRFREQTGSAMLVMTVILTLSAAAISIGVVYNNARVTLSMRSRDLASLRVLGFTRAEISRMLLGELGAQVIAGIPLGLWLGTQWSRYLAARIDPETIRFQVHITDQTYAMAALIALVSGVISALFVRRKLDRLDLVGVLKSSE